MYVTEVLLGRPYQSYVPKPMAPALSSCLVRSFEALDRSILANPVAGHDEAARAVLQYDDEPSSPGSRTRGVAQALDRLMRQRKFGVRELQDANALLTHREGGGFRRVPVWIGAPHPADSTHVGSPAGRLESLSREIFSLRERSGPVSLWAIVAMVRLLQVHPFADGNGRTARLYACWAAQRGLGGSDLFPGIVSALWMRANFCVNAACIAVRDHEEWTPLLERCLDAAAQWAPRSPRHALPGPLPGTPAFPAGHGLR